MDDVRRANGAAEDPCAAETDELAAEVIELLRAGEETIATCESLTAGLVAASLARVPGASEVLRGGLVTYATDLKASLAGVDASLLAERGAVDPDVAAAMARGAASACGARIGLACTGVAGPDPQDGMPVGRVYIAMAVPACGSGGSERPAVEEAAPGQVRVERLDLGGGRNAVRRATVSECLRLVRAGI